jgi:glycogen debranching enzyme
MASIPPDEATTNVPTFLWSCPSGRACAPQPESPTQENASAAPQCADQYQKTHHADRLSDWLRSVLKIRCSNEEFYRLYRQALEDMAALRLPIIGTDHKVFLPAAGLPWFVAPFGRDALIVSLQNMLDLSGLHPRQPRYHGLAPGEGQGRLP